MAIRDYIRTLLEAMIQPEAAAASGLALCVNWNSELPSLILYSTEKANEILRRYQSGEPPPEIANDEEAMFFWRHDTGLKMADPSIVVGYMALVPPAKGFCYGAEMVQLVAADRGYGPLLYDIAMRMIPSHTLVSDRKSVTFAAQRVWDKYFKERGDVEALPLDDVNDPKTPPPEDDCVLHHGSRPVLNHAYRGPGKDPSPLLRAHRTFSRTVAKKAKSFGLDYSVGDFEEALYRAGRQFFGGRYYSDI
jgi:hypothetical protein